MTGAPAVVSAVPLDRTDLDDDGIIYVLEDAFLSNPDNPLSRDLPDLNISSSGIMSLSFRAPADTEKVGGTEDGTLFSASENLIFNIQLSDDLRNWTQDASLLDTDLFTAGGLGRIVSAKQTNAIGAGAKRHMRVGVERRR
ncbi:MAG: hypothetical protein AAGA58_04510 [Verrucomicrobiota bacterium]